MKETIAKINKSKSIKKISKIDKPLSGLFKKKKGGVEKTQINKITNENEVTTYNAEIQRIKRDYYEKLYGNKIDNVEEIDKF